LSNLPDAIKVTARSPTKSRMVVDDSEGEGEGEGDASETAAESKVGDDEDSLDRDMDRDVDMGEGEGEDTAVADATATAAPVAVTSAVEEEEAIAETGALTVAVVTMEDAAALESERTEHSVPMEHSGEATEGMEVALASAEEPEKEAGTEKEEVEAEEGEGEKEMEVEVVEEPEAEEAVEEEEPVAFEERADVLLLEVAMQRARTLWPARHAALRSNFLVVTRDMSVGMCQDLMAHLSRGRREFNDHLDFDRLMQELMIAF